MTGGVIREMFDVLEGHGYHRHDDQHTVQAVGMIVDLASIYEGTHDAYFQPAPPAPYAGPGPSGPETDDAVILNDTDVSTLFGALEIAADYTRDRAEMCTDCPDQSCLTCQSRLRDAQAYDHMAAQLLQTAEASRTARSHQPEPDDPSDSPFQPHPAADKEAGQ
jgi:hypothetical protein